MPAAPRPAARRVASAWSLRTSTSRSRGWRSTSDLAFTDGRFTDEPSDADQIPGAIDTAISAGVVLGESEGWFGSFRTRYFGPRDLVEDGSVEGSSSFLCNGRIGYRQARWEVSVDVLNIFDREDNDIEYYYESRLAGEPPEGVADIHFHPVEPRTISRFRHVAILNAAKLSGRSCHVGAGPPLIGLMFFRVDLHLMRKRFVGIPVMIGVLLAVASALSAADNPVTIAILSNAGRAPISPFIYGTNQDLTGARVTARRFGGNRTTGYNWENNASNAGSDYFHQSDDFLTWVVGIADPQANIPGIVLTDFHDDSLVGWRALIRS